MPYSEPNKKQKKCPPRNLHTAAVYVASRNFFTKITIILFAGVDPVVIYTVPEVDENTTLNNFGDNINLKVDRNRQKNATESDLKYILFWNEAYGTKEYDIGFGRQPFYDNLCPETRCVTTEDRNLKPVEEFDAVFFHQRSLDFSDIPDKKKRKVCEVFFVLYQNSFLCRPAKGISISSWSLLSTFIWTYIPWTDFSTGQ